MSNPKEREERYLRMMRERGYQDSLMGMDDDDIEWALTKMDPRPAELETPQLGRTFRPPDRGLAERIFNMFKRPFDPNWQMPNLDGPEFRQPDKPKFGFNPDDMRPLPYKPGKEPKLWGTEPYLPGNEKIVPYSYSLTGGNSGSGSAANDGNWSIDPFGMFPQYGNGQPSTGSATGSGTPDNYRSNDVGVGLSQINAPRDAAGGKGDPSGVSTNSGFPDYLRKLGFHESSGDYKIKNEGNYLGKYQLGSLALADAGFYNLGDGEAKSYRNLYNGTWTDKAKAYGVNSVEDYLNNPKAQEAAVRDFSKKNWDYIRENGYDKYIGKEIHGVKVTASGLLAVGHLLGSGGVGKLFGGEGPYETDERGVPMDGNRTPATKYLEKMGGVDISGLLGYNPDKK